MESQIKTQQAVTDTIAVLDVDYKRDLETIINNMQAQILAE